MCGFPLTFVLPSKRSEIPIYSNFLALRSAKKLSRQKAEMKRYLHNGQSVQPSPNII